ncbi:hypothetical protein CWATWH0401_853 [Crocosphaera watsonii WH 0401]|uniref:Uncharacterized protein n=2 Tax=Crocosphaera watsonii TaxID=263511 RepID=T2J0S4_CROWT|nr:hypothetical protein CWATWH0005_3025 [Crocosphaera watsonii WH 0005]CCQ60431.1 hypothetical protein CWATWH0401_853 [Crocosphaera watsonii WH 0401]
MKVMMGMIFLPHYLGEMTPLSGMVGMIVSRVGMGMTV